MMAQNPVAAKEGGMKHYADCKGLTMRLSSNLCRFFRTGWLFLKDWIPGQATPPNRYALWRGPRQPGMTQIESVGACFGAGGCF